MAPKKTKIREVFPKKADRKTQTKNRKKGVDFSKHKSMLIATKTKYSKKKPSSWIVTEKNKTDAIKKGKKYTLAGLAWNLYAKQRGMIDESEEEEYPEYDYETSDDEDDYYMDCDDHSSDDNISDEDSDMEDLFVASNNTHKEKGVYQCLQKKGKSLKKTTKQVSASKKNKSSLRHTNMSHQNQAPVEPIVTLSNDMETWQDKRGLIQLSRETEKGGKCLMAKPLKLYFKEMNRGNNYIVWPPKKRYIRKIMAIEFQQKVQGGLPKLAFKSDYKKASQTSLQHELLESVQSCP